MTETDVVSRRRLTVAAESAEQNAPEATTHEAVDDEVDARVDGEKQVAGDVDVEQVAARECDVAGRVLVQRHPGAQDEVRQLADDEDDDDNYENARVLALLAAAAAAATVSAAGHLPSHSAGCPHRTDQPLVEERQRRERNEESNDEEEAGFVDEDVNGALAHCRPPQRDLLTDGSYPRRRDGSDEIR